MLLEPTFQARYCQCNGLATATQLAIDPPPTQRLSAGVRSIQAYTLRCGLLEKRAMALKATQKSSNGRHRLGWKAIRKRLKSIQLLAFVVFCEQIEQLIHLSQQVAVGG
ncbi:MAG: hypothetical protein ABI127_09775 [Dokdonella sp.]